MARDLTKVLDKIERWTFSMTALNRFPYRDAVRVRALVAIARAADVVVKHDPPGGGTCCDHRLRDLASAMEKLGEATDV